MRWYEDEQMFDRATPLPAGIDEYAGPRGVALVDVYGEGKTTLGWGLQPRNNKPGFMENYTSRKFWAKPRIIAAQKNAKPFAIIMRSVSLVAVDIDRHLDEGGHDGFLAAAKLELPPTLAQTSKSGRGRHLFYIVPDVWDDELGYGMYDDIIGLAPGIDLRAVGCIYRHDTQRWNRNRLVEASPDLFYLMDKHKARKNAVHQQLTATAAADPNDEEALIMHDALLQELNKPIGQGKRNNTLFAIGSQMKTAAYPNWEIEIDRRATEVGLDSPEVAKLISNIQRYGV